MRLSKECHPVPFRLRIVQDSNCDIKRLISVSCPRCGKCKTERLTQTPYMLSRYRVPTVTKQTQTKLPDRLRHCWGPTGRDAHKYFTHAPTRSLMDRLEGRSLEKLTVFILVQGGPADGWVRSPLAFMSNDVINQRK